MNFKSFRTSMQWTRLLDQDGNINPEGAAWYHKLIDCANENGIDIFMNMYHFDMPEYLYKRGGWANREVVEAYANFVKKAMEEFGGKVKYWFTFNEPIVEPEQQYLHGVWFPYEKNIKRSLDVQYNITLAHCLAVMNFRELQARGKMVEGAKIGMINCFAPPYTKEDPSPEDLEAVRMTDGLHNRWWLDVVAHGHLPKDVIDTVENEWKIKMNRRPGDEAILAGGKVDWLGFNYYQPTRIQAPDQKFDENGLPCIAKPYIWPERRMNEHRGWEIYPKGIYDFGMKIKNECPDLPYFISENGMGVEGEEKYMDENGSVQDDYRIEFVRDHLEWIAKAIEDGSNCLGYHYWGVIDNWSWANAFKNRYGFIRVALDQGYKRIEKKSANWIREVAKNNEFEQEVSNHFLYFLLIIF